MTMRYLVRISEMRYGEVEVEAESEEKAKEIASGKEINFYDSEITDMSAELVKDDRTYKVIEVCPHCMNEIEMTWDTDQRGFKAFCPVCGKRLMLCDECMHLEDGRGCDYDSKNDCCRFSRKGGEQCG